MHVTPNELRGLRQHGIVIHYALLGTMAYVVAEIPADGSRGSAIEEPCVKPHWGLVLVGDINFEVDGHAETLRAGAAFHVPAGGSPHRFQAKGAVRLAGFEPIDVDAGTSDSALAARGFEILAPGGLLATTGHPASVAAVAGEKQVIARSWPMGSMVLTEARFGPGSGYTTNWCDVSHWGMVTSGRIAIEWEDDLEILSEGDVYHCPAGPPGHRLEAADPARIIDLSPLDAMMADRRIATWRQRPGTVGGDPIVSRISVASLD